MKFGKAIVAVGLTVLALVMAMPTAALAWWDAGAEVTSLSTIVLNGSAKFAGAIGTISCTKGVDAEAKLVGKSDNGELRIFFITEPETNCTVEGGLKTLGCTALSSALSTSTPSAIDGITASDSATVTGVVIDNVLTGGVFCPKTLVLEGNTTLTFDNVKAIKTVTLGGELTITSAAPPANVLVSGTLAVTPSGTYGLTK
jgi:hypothetical protein